jgi:hypothetical protein
MRHSVSDFLRDRGIEYARSAPAALLWPLVAFFFLVWLVYHLWREAEKPLQSASVWAAIAALVIVVLAVPGAWIKAKDYCDQVHGYRLSADGRVSRVSDRSATIGQLHGAELSDAIKRCQNASL